jgi:hypothetical protein
MSELGDMRILVRRLAKEPAKLVEALVILGEHPDFVAKAMLATGDEAKLRWVIVFLRLLATKLDNPGKV